MAIVMIVHVKEQARTSAAPAWRAGASFYAACLALGYAAVAGAPRPAA